MKFVYSSILAFILSHSMVFGAQPSSQTPNQPQKPQRHNCHCINCQCTPESHCGCYSAEGCHCTPGHTCGQRPAPQQQP